MEEQGGGPQEIAFMGAAAGWFRAKTLGPPGTCRPPHHKHPLGQPAPPLRYQARFTGSLGSFPGNWKPSLLPRGLRVFTWTTLPSRSPTPAEAERPGKTWGPGAVAGGQTWFHASCSGPGRARACPRTRSPVGTQACTPPGRLRFLLWLKLPHPTPRQQTLTQWLQPCSLC